jgi:hypothetical protein
MALLSGKLLLDPLAAAYRCRVLSQIAGDGRLNQLKRPDGLLGEAWSRGPFPFISNLRINGKVWKTTTGQADPREVR